MPMVGEKDTGLIEIATVEGRWSTWNKASLGMCHRVLVLPWHRVTDNMIIIHIRIQTKTRRESSHPSVSHHHPQENSKMPFKVELSHFS